MWLTGIVSYPLAWLLDTIAGRDDRRNIFTNEEMAAVIKYHDLSKNSQGTIGADAARIMVGALNLDTRKIGADIPLIPMTDIEGQRDVENGDTIILQRLMVNWSEVKTIHIDDVVDEDFIAKVIAWSHSCIPVLGGSDGSDKDNSSFAPGYSWDGQQIFGLLHIKVSNY